MIRRHRFVAAVIVWTAVWLVLDLSGGGLIESGFNTAGLEQAYMFLLYPLGLVLIAGVWVTRQAWRALRGRRRDCVESSY